MDFVLVTVALLALCRRGWYCSLVLLPSLVSFTVFVVSSGLKRLVYDPIGKYLGAFLMVMVVLTLLLPYPPVRKVLTYVLVLLCALSLCSRIVFLHRGRRGGSAA